MKDWFKKNTGFALCLFLLTVGLIEPVVPNAGRTVFTVFLLIFGWLHRSEIKVWLKNHSQEKIYLALLSFFAFYGLLLIIVWLFLPNPQQLRISYANIEELLLNYLLLPLFCVLIGLHLTQKTFERAMLLFSCCTVIGGCFLLYAHFDIKLLFTDPLTFFNNVLQCRFTGCPSHIPWVIVFLKNYSFFPALGALAVAPFIWKYTRWRKLGVFILFLMNTLFLFFTINRGTLIGFVLSLLLLLFYKLRHFSLKKKLLWSVGVILAACLVILILPQSIKGRFVEAINDIHLFFTTGHDTGSASTRLTIWKILLSHADSFWLFGEGPVYAAQKLWLYMSEAGYQNYIEQGFIYHSQYLTYFHHFGIIGLLFLPTMLIYPVYVMIRRRKFSITLVGILILFAIALIEDRYLGNAKTAVLLFFIYFSFFHIEKWRNIEN